LGARHRLALREELKENKKGKNLLKEKKLFST
jgi:hypothetical protein